MLLTIYILSSILCSFTNASAPAQSYYLYNNNEIELAAPYPEDNFLPLFKKYGEVSMDKNSVYLTRGQPKQQAAIWSKRALSDKHWQVVFAFRIKGKSIGGNGLGFWYTRDGHRTGSIYGGPDKFDGFGLFFDTFDEETKSETVPMVVGMMGDGQTPFRQAVNSTSSESKVVGSCYKQVRNTDAPVYVRLTYFNRHVKVEIDNQHEGRSYSTCFDAFNIDLPIGNHFGVSASTNIFPDTYEVYALRTAMFSTVSRHADKLAIDKMAENEIFKEQTTVVKMVEGIKMMVEKQSELVSDFRSVLGRPAADQLPLNNRMEALERDIRHLDNHLDRTEETLHAMMVLLKNIFKDSNIRDSTSKSNGVNSVTRNIRENFYGYITLLALQALITFIGILYIRYPKKGPIRKAL